MNVLALTIFLSLILAGIFITCFAAECLRKDKSSPEHDSLLPLDDQRPANHQAQQTPENR